MKKLILLLLAAAVATTAAAQAQRDTLTFNNDYYFSKRNVEELVPVTGQNIVMLGNSLTENGGDWGKRLGKKNVVNRGIIGDEVMGVYNRLHQILPGQPREMYLMIGINDVSHNLTADSIAVLIRLTVDRIQRELPQTKLHLQSLLPINESFGRYKLLTGKTDLIPQINTLLKELAAEKQIDFIDLFPLFTEQGTNVLRRELTTDGLHLNEQGYKIWAKALKKH